VGAAVQKLEKKQPAVAQVDGKKDKKKEQQIKHFKERSQEMSMFRMKSMLFVGLILFVVYTFLSNMYDGIAIGKLPFTPFPLLRGT
jgi:hypothetical protein